MSQRYKKWQRKKAKAERNSARDLKKLRILPENSAEGPGPGASTLGLRICLWEYNWEVAASFP